MNCSRVRESLSAAFDGERAPLDAAVVRAHVAGCIGCAAFARSLQPLAVEPAPDLSALILARRRKPAARSMLRLGIELAALTELGFALYNLLTDVQHDVHESSSLAVAICVGLLIAASRPHLAKAYFPIAGVASMMLVITSVTDVDAGRVGPMHESPHLALVIGTALLGMLAWHESGPPSWWAARAPRHHRPVASLRLHVVHRSWARGGRLIVGGLVMALLVLVAAPAQAGNKAERTAGNYQVPCGD